MTEEDTKQIIDLLHSIDRRLATVAGGLGNDLPPSINPHQGYTRRQTARLLGVSTWTVDRARKDGLLIEARRVGRRDIRITGESILEFHHAARRSAARIQKL